MSFPVWKEIFLFEVRYHRRQPLVYVTALALFLLAVMFVSTGMAAKGEGLPGAVNYNAPYVILHMMAGLTAFGVFVVTAFVASSALRDFRLGSHSLFFSKPVGRVEYLTGRFAGSMVVSAAVLAFATLGILAGAHAPWTEPDRVGPFTLAPYVYGLLVIVLPNLLMTGAVFFAMASLTRSLFATYIGVVVFVILQDEAEVLVRDVEHGLLGSFIEPLGIAAMDHVARYWTVAEYNTLLPGPAWTLLGNRLIWLVIGLGLFAWSCHRFSYSRASAEGGRKRAKVVEAVAPAPAAVIPRGARTAAARERSFGACLRQMLRQARLETGFILRGIPFLVFLLLAVSFILFSADQIAQVRGTPVYPVTHLMLRSVTGAMGLFLLVVVTVYAGEAVWRERSLGLSPIYDSLPVPNGVFLGAKLLALGIMAAVFMLAGILTTIGFQIWQGFFHLRPGLYASGFVLLLWPYLLMAVVAVFLQILANNKFAGYLLLILVVLAHTRLPLLGLEHNLLCFPAHLGIPYSDLNGYGHHLEAYVWFKLYWSFGAAVLVVLSMLLLVRGTESGFRARLDAARARMRGPLPVAGACAALGFLATGAFIYYNTNILNEYLPNQAVESLQAGYETLYGRYRDLPQPRITRVDADVDIFPSQRRVEIRGTYALENRTPQAVSAIHLSINPLVVINRMETGREARITSDPEHGYYIHELAEPLAPGETARLEFDLSVRNRGFLNRDPKPVVVANGTFFTNTEYFPSIGYDTAIQIEDPSLRRKHGLPPAPRMASLEDEAARRNNYVTRDADWVRFEATLSTRPDQIAIAPGYLVREWEENGRRYFRYEMDAPVLDFFSFSSADYAVRRDRWGDVAIQVYYHEGHPYNVDRMIDAVKKSLDYYTRNFGPYQHRQVRILEFPAYASYAQAFPNTIPYSESAGFIARIRDRDDIDYVFNTTAHEVAHQWWAHQVIGADVQGATLLSESLSEYSALMVMEKEYGPERMRRFLQYELDGYLRGRGREVADEMPLMRVENQMYIHYNKGSLVLYALRDYIGEERLNRALARFLREFAFQGPPYPTATDLLDEIRGEVPPELDYIIEDMFETLTLYANRAVSASAAPQGDGSYLVTLEVEARKLRAEGNGAETEIPIDDWIDIGVLDEEGRPLLLEKRRVSETMARFELEVKGEPALAGIDPFHKLIDRAPEDNVRRVRKATGTE